jgi:hypothetical protein
MPERPPIEVMAGPGSNSEALIVTGYPPVTGYPGSPVTWTVISRGRPMGTFPENQLLQWVAAGQVDPDDLFWRHGMITAAPVKTLMPFAAYFSSRSLGDDAAMRWLLPVGRSPWAIAAGYLGLFSILGVFGPFAIVAGLLGVRQIRNNERLHGLGRAIFGIVAGTLATVIYLLIFISR